MYYQGEIEKKDRQKVIMIATAIVAVVLILVVAIIVVATRKTGGDSVGGENNEPIAVEETPKTEEKANDPSTEKTTVPVSTKTTEAQATATAVPDTGPEDLLPLALVLGVLTTAGTAYIMSRKQQA